MQDAADSPQPPVVFVSYSHDTAEHKRWVGELASRLVRGGVDVIIDQWDTGLGDDLPKFMEKAVGRADRVLLICSDAYVQKADDGKGGAGYEAMIVTGELAKNLGMNKFIPIIRQPHDNIKKPKFLETKFHIDFSDDRHFEERLEELFREIHKVPKFPKPKLGRNPFADEVKQESPVSPSLRLDLSVAVQVPNDARDAYFRALDFARNNDKIGWRKFLLRASSAISPQLFDWRKTEGDKLPNKTEDLPQWALPGVTSVSPIIAIALAGVESQSEFFRNQVGLIDEFLRPANWELSGNTVVTRFPEMLAFVYQALLGSVAMQTVQADIAKRLAWVEIPEFSGARESSPLFRSSRVTGWPESLNHTCTTAWAFLLQLPEHWPWLNEIFGDADHYKAALCSYYAVLNLIEFIDAVEQKMDLSKPQNVWPTVPISFTMMGEAISRRGLRLLEENRSTLAEVWQSSKVDNAAKLGKWEEWEGVMGGWIHNVYRGGVWHWSPFHTPFVKSL
jgi:hypothetical protein